MYIYITMHDSDTYLLPSIQFIFQDDPPLASSSQNMKAAMVVDQPPPGVQLKSKTNNDSTDYQMVYRKLDNMHTQWKKLYEGVNGSLVYLCGCIEKLTNDVHKVESLVNAMHDQGMAAKMLKKPVEFPLKSKEEVEEYIKKDPKCEAALDRSVFISLMLFVHETYFMLACDSFSINLYIHI